MGYNGGIKNGTEGIGEIVLIPTASAIANALFDAVGVRIFLDYLEL